MKNVKTYKDQFEGALVQHELLGLPEVGLLQCGALVARGPAVARPAPHTVLIVQPGQPRGQLVHHQVLGLGGGGWCVIGQLLTSRKK